ncbi:hypothetical protein [Variovorax sp. EL159]|uniref:hypothetical protein n=1 Tax=unclassified Variovorax TaxID=663243 RepID=UPI00088262F2|nr:hypothetical protein [Variovorax sp. EL159]SCX68773.1 hypothetical protein SAMN03159363_3341 [Variovorax sp. EL159]
MRVQWPGEPQRLPTGTEDDMATKPVPAGCFIRRATGLVEGRRLEERDVAMGPEKSGRFAGLGPADEPGTATGFEIRE